MSNELVVSVVSLVTSVATAALALRQNIKTSKIAGDANLAIEKLRADNERRRQALELATKEVGPIEEALVKAWSECQTIKDSITRVLQGNEPLRERLPHERKKINECFGRLY